MDAVAVAAANTPVVAVADIPAAAAAAVVNTPPLAGNTSPAAAAAEANTPSVPAEGTPPEGTPPAAAKGYYSAPRYTSEQDCAPAAAGSKAD